MTLHSIVQRKPHRDISTGYPCVTRHLSIMVPWAQGNSATHASEPCRIKYCRWLMLSAIMTGPRYQHHCLLAARSEEFRGVTTSRTKEWEITSLSKYDRGTLHPAADLCPAYQWFRISGFMLEFSICFRMLWKEETRDATVGCSDRRLFKSFLLCLYIIAVARDFKSQKNHTICTCRLESDFALRSIELSLLR